MGFMECVVGCRGFLNPRIYFGMMTNLGGFRSTLQKVFSRCIFKVFLGSRDRLAWSLSMNNEPYVSVCLSKSRPPPNGGTEWLPRSYLYPSSSLRSNGRVCFQKGFQPLNRTVCLGSPSILRFNSRGCRNGYKTLCSLWWPAFGPSGTDWMPFIFNHSNGLKSHKNAANFDVSWSDFVWIL